MSITIQIDGNGVIRHLSNDRLDAGMNNAGPVLARRASHVEANENGFGWYVDLSPVGGPILSGFITREEALEAEVTWLTENGFPDVITPPANPPSGA